MDFRDQIAAKRAELDRLRPLTPRGLSNLEHVHDLELTYTSNAIEGNTLTAVETTLVIEQGITIGGKPLKDHMEAIDLYEAIHYVRALARRETALTEMDIRTLHSLVMKRSAPEIGGHYAAQGRFVLTATGRQAFPSPAEIPALMGDLATWLAAAPDTPPTAFTARRRLVEIHPFNDGNGRTARLLMNLILLRGHYPPIAVRPEDRPAYILALQQSEPESFARLLYQRLSPHRPRKASNRHPESDPARGRGSLQPSSAAWREPTPRVERRLLRIGVRDRTRNGASAWDGRSDTSHIEPDAPRGIWTVRPPRAKIRHEHRST